MAASHPDSDFSRLGWAGVLVIFLTVGGSAAPCLSKTEPDANGPPRKVEKSAEKRAAAGFECTAGAGSEGAAGAGSEGAAGAGSEGAAGAGSEGAAGAGSEGAAGAADAPMGDESSPKAPVTTKFEPSNRLDRKSSTDHSTRLERSREQRVSELFTEAVALIRSNRAYAARAPLEKALLLAPRSAGIHCNLGLAYQNSGNMERAINEFKTALSLNPSMPEAILNLAGCYQSTGQNVEAIRWYEKYVRENPLTAQTQQVKDIIAALKQMNVQGGSSPAHADYFANITAQGVFRWPREKLPLKVYIESGEGVDGYRQSFQNLLLDAFAQWCHASGGRISILKTDKRDEADIRCSWTSNPQDVTESGSQGERGSARIVVKSNSILRAGLKVLTRPVLDEGTLSDDDMQKACLHEVGHVLGLQGHSTNNHDVMFFTVDTATVWPVLTKRDKATITRLYESYPPIVSASALNIDEGRPDAPGSKASGSDAPGSKASGQNSSRSASSRQ